MKQPSDKKWQNFERLVAAIHTAEAQGAVVTWDDEIGGRQFDVTLRFNHGLYSYLTVIECKDYCIRVPVKEVEAFSTKQRHAKANKAVMVSASGFQEGCYTVARTDNIGLYTLTELNKLPDGYFMDDLILVLNVFDVVMIEPSGAEHRLRDEGGSIRYYIQHSTLIDGSLRDPVQRLIDVAIRDKRLPFGRESIDVQIKMPPGSKVELPHNDGVVPVLHVQFSAQIAEARVLRVPIDPALVPRCYSFKDELTGSYKEVQDAGLGLGVETVLTAGKFYVNPTISFYYYCRSVEGALAHLILVESYQHGILIQAEFSQKTKHAHFYVEVKEEATLRRLRFMLERLDKHSLRPPNR